VLWARPGEPLLDHLVAVGQLAEGWAPPELKASARLAGRVHDLYKATPWFQRYLAAEEREKQRYRAELGPRLHHAFPGALFGAWVAQRRGLDAPAIFLSVARHHGHLKTPTALLPDPRDPKVLKRGESPYAAVRDQTRALAESSEAIALLDALGLQEDFQDYLEEDLEAWARTLRRTGRKTGEFWRTTRLFSLLIDADKRLAAGVKPPPRRPLPAQAAESLVASLPRTSPIAHLRAQLFNAVDRIAQNDPLDTLFPAALTLSAPTGSGKTLTLFNFALKLRERVERDRGLRPRIVYALPYVNLIEQNRAVLSEALTQAGADPTKLLIAHHHLSEVGDETEFSALEDALLLAEAWEAEVVVTTFVQVAETLFGTRNRMLKKLHRLTGGTLLLLDEVQAFPVEHWPLLRSLLGEFVELGNTVVLATATQPALLPGARELAPALPGYPVRVRIETADGPPRKPATAPRLVVVNTIARSLTVYHEQKALGGRVYYLSTNLTPKDREAVLERLRADLKDARPLTLVATPIVEAGLDLDFHEAWREVGPVEAVVQVAGRVNRSAERSTGTLYLMPDEGSLGRVYGRVLSEVARSFFQDRLPTTDRELSAALSEYFAEIESRLASDRVQGFLEAKASLRFCRPGNPEGCGACAPGQPEACDVCCFALIQENLVRVPIFIEQDGAATEILSELAETLRETNPIHRRARLRALRPQLARYTINPIAPLAAKNLPAETLFGREDYRMVPREQLAAYYHPETGFQWKRSLEDQFL